MGNRGCHDEEVPVLQRVKLIVSSLLLTIFFCTSAPTLAFIYLKMYFTFRIFVFQIQIQK